MALHTSGDFGQTHQFAGVRIRMAHLALHFERPSVQLMIECNRLAGGILFLLGCGDRSER